MESGAVIAIVLSIVLSIAYWALVATHMRYDREAKTWMERRGLFGQWKAARRSNKLRREEE